MQGLPQETRYDPRVRQEGGGRKDYEQLYPDIDASFLNVLQNYTAGNPMDDSVHWTNLTPKEIAVRLADTHQIDVSVTVIHVMVEAVMVLVTTCSKPICSIWSMTLV